MSGIKASWKAAQEGWKLTRSWKSEGLEAEPMSAEQMRQAHEKLGELVGWMVIGALAWGCVGVGLMAVGAVKSAPLMMAGLLMAMPVGLALGLVAGVATAAQECVEPMDEQERQSWAIWLQESETVRRYQRRVMEKRRLTKRDWALASQWMGQRGSEREEKGAA